VVDSLDLGDGESRRKHGGLVQERSGRETGLIMSKVRRSPDRQDYFMVVVPFMPEEEADKAFAAWLAEQDLRPGDLASRDLIVDTARSRDGRVRRRYRVYLYAYNDRE